MAKIKLWFILVLIVLCTSLILSCANNALTSIRQEENGGYSLIYNDVEYKTMPAIRWDYYPLSDVQWEKVGETSQKQILGGKNYEVFCNSEDNEKLFLLANPKSAFYESMIPVQLRLYRNNFDFPKFEVGSIDRIEIKKYIGCDSGYLEFDKLKYFESQDKAILGSFFDLLKDAQKIDFYNNTDNFKWEYQIAFINNELKNCAYTVLVVEYRDEYWILWSNEEATKITNEYIDFLSL